MSMDFLTDVAELFEKYNIPFEEANRYLYNEDGSLKSLDDPFVREFMDIVHSVFPIRDAASATVKNCPDISSLFDDELYDRLPDLLWDGYSSNDIVKTCFVVYEFEMEFANGGVEQYFVNTKGEHFFELIECLSLINATSYAEKCKNFISKNNISDTTFLKYVDDISCEDIGDAYPYDELEKDILTVYYDDPLSKYIVEYVRLNKNEFNKN